MRQPPASHAPARLPRLRHWRDLQSLAYLVALPLIAWWQWQHGWNLWLYGIELFLTLGVGVIHHNHTHLRMWRGRRANRFTDYWLTLLQGHPTFVFWPAHVANHHLRWLGQLRRHWPGAFRYCMGQYLLWLGSWALLLSLDWQKALLLVIIPQLHGLHWLLATNYLQHAHADGRPLTRGQRLDPATALNYARNFEGWVNPLLFNIGLHTAHHERPQAHWSELTRLHREHYRQRVAPELNEGGLLPYMGRVFLLGTIWPPARTRAQMPRLPAGTPD
jgi:hypothetical protein